MRLELCCQSRCLKFGMGVSTDVPTTEKYVGEVKALKLEEASVIEQNGISDHNASCCPAFKSHSAGISGFSILKNMERFIFVDTAEWSHISCGDSGLPSLSPGMDTVQHVARKDGLSAFIGASDHFEYTEVNVKPNYH